MILSPLLDPFYMGCVTEVIFVARFLEPLALTASLAGSAAVRGQAEKLAAGIMNVGSEEDFAAAALAPVSLGTHPAQNGKKTERADQPKSGATNEKKTEEGRKLFSQNLEENQSEENPISNRRFSPTIIPPLTPKDGQHRKKHEQAYFHKISPECVDDFWILMKTKEYLKKFFCLQYPNCRFVFSQGKKPNYGFVAERATLRAFGRKLALLRKKAAITQEALAEKINVSSRSIQKMEAGEVNVPLLRLAEIKQAVGCRWEDLMP